MGFVSEIGPLMGLTLQNMLNWPASLRESLVSIAPVLGLHSHVPISSLPFFNVGSRVKLWSPYLYSRYLNK